MYTRRRFTATLTGLLLLILGTGGTPMPANGQTPSTAKRTLVILNWSEYLDPGLVAAFEKAFNADIKEVYFESDDLRDDLMLETGGRGYDLVVVNGISVDIYRKRGWLAPLDKDRLPNLAHIDNRWRETFPGVKDYAVPYFWGTLGIAYRSDLLDNPPTSWNDLLRPAEALRGRIGMIDNARDAIGMALKARGYSANSTDPREIEAAGKLLMEQKPFVRSYTYIALNEDSALVSGDIVATMLYSGDALMVQEHNDAIAYVLPKEGGNIWADYLTVAAGSEHKDLAWAFINFLNEPANAAQLAEYVYYATPNRAAEKLLPREFLEDPVIYPSSDALQKSEVYKPLPPRVLKKRNQIFSSIRQ